MYCNWFDIWSIMIDPAFRLRRYGIYCLCRRLQLSLSEVALRNTKLDASLHRKGYQRLIVLLVQQEQQGFKECGMCNSLE